MLLWRVRAKSRAVIIGRLVRVRSRPDLRRLGSPYGGWWVPLSLLSADSVCYLAGVGEDVTFDLALIKTVGCDVWSLDPTPRAMEHVKTVTEPKFHFLPEGLWAEDAYLKFYEPVNPAHVSHSVLAKSHADGYFMAQCRSLRSLMTALGHARIDLLKMDIEGAEVAVLDDILANGPLPQVLCVEFDAPETPWRSLRRIRNLKAAGYRVVKTEGLNVTFVRERSV